MMKDWMADVVACSDGNGELARKRCESAEHGIPLRNRPIRYLEGADEVLMKITFESGRWIYPGAVCFFRRAAEVQAIRPIRRLGGKRNAKGVS